MASETDSTVAYIRRSTQRQENEHQYESVRNWLADRGQNPSEIEFLEETASGSSRSREKFNELIDRIEDGEVDEVVVWELSRIARDGELSQRFFNLCEENNVHVHVTSGTIRELTPDGSNRFVADILAATYAEERRTLIRRTKYGQQRAMNAGKWVGKPPLGFTTDEDGYLITNVEFYERFNDDRPGFWAVEAALERIDDGNSYRSTASRLGCSRAALRSLYEDEERRRWFEDREADDERVQTALEELDAIEGDQS